MVFKVSKVSRDYIGDIPCIVLEERLWRKALCIVLEEFAGVEIDQLTTAVLVEILCKAKFLHLIKKF